MPRSCPRSRGGCTDVLRVRRGFLREGKGGVVELGVRAALRLRLHSPGVGRELCARFARQAESGGRSAGLSSRRQPAQPLAAATAGSCSSRSTSTAPPVGPSCLSASMSYCARSCPSSRTTRSCSASVRCWPSRTVWAASAPGWRYDPLRRQRRFRGLQSSCRDPLAVCARAFAAARQPLPHGDDAARARTSSRLARSQVSVYLCYAGGGCALPPVHGAAGC